ncbi:MAG: hypothetical protein LBV21_04110 [Candidatus Adiutrix sp.]|nr:hypothetical protein [Candidatus Adiutrix sp.]
MPARVTKEEPGLDELKALAEYESCWAREDFSRATALMERLLRQSPGDPEWRWYRAAALARQGRWAAAETESQADRLKGSPPGDNLKNRPADDLEALARLLDPPWRREDLFTLTLATASPELCEYFWERLGVARAPRILRRLGASRPEAALEAEARVRRRLRRGSLAELPEALTDFLARLLARPWDNGHILRVIYVLQAWEDLLSAEAQLDGPDTEGGPAAGVARPQIELAGIIAQSFAPLYEETRCLNIITGLEGFCHTLGIMELGLRAGRPLEHISRELLAVNSRPTAVRLRQATAYQASGDLAKNCRLLGAARQIHTAAYKKFSGFRRLDPSDWRKAQKKFTRQTEKCLQPTGFRLLGVFACDVLCLGLDRSVDFSAFIAPEADFYLVAMKASVEMTGLIGKIIAGLAHFLGCSRIMRTTSRLSDGRIIGVLQSGISQWSDLPPNFIIEKVSRWASPLEIVRRHQRLLERCLAEAPGVTCLAAPSRPEELRQAEEHIESLTSEYRQSLANLVTPEELKKLLKSNYKEWSGLVIEKIALLERLRREAELTGAGLLKPD